MKHERCTAENLFCRCADGVYNVIKEKPIFGKEFYKQLNYCKAWR